MWPTSFSGLSVIVNWENPRHRDPGGGPTHFDALVSAGTHQGAHLEIPDMGLTLTYNSGMVVIILASRLLSHRVPCWEDGERRWLAYYTKDCIHERYEVEQPCWPHLDDYQHMMGELYRGRQEKLSAEMKKRRWEDWCILYHFESLHRLIWIYFSWFLNWF